MTAEGVKPDKEKKRAVTEMNRQNDVQDLQTFLGFKQYLSKFLPNMSDVSAHFDSFWRKTSVGTGTTTKSRASHN